MCEHSEGSGIRYAVRQANTKVQIAQKVLVNEALRVSMVIGDFEEILVTPYHYRTRDDVDRDDRRLSTYTCLIFWMYTVSSENKLSFSTSMYTRRFKKT